jgi:thioredoxin-like negative regulator of GroEL
MDADTYSNADVIEWSNKTVVNVGLRTDRHAELAGRFKVDAIPSTYLVDADGERVAEWIGYVGPKEYRSGVESAIQAHKDLKRLEPELAAKPDDPTLNDMVGACYVLMGNSRRAADAFLKAASKVADPARKGATLVRAFGSLNRLEAAEGVNAEILAVAKELDAVDPDGKLGFRDDAAYARAMADFNREKWADVIARLEELVAKFPDGDRVPEAMFNLGDLYHHVKKDNPKAEKVLKALIERFPKSEHAANAKAFLEHMKAHQEK